MSVANGMCDIHGHTPVANWCVACAIAAEQDAGVVAVPSDDDALEGEVIERPKPAARLVLVSRIRGVRRDYSVVDATQIAIET